MSIHPRFASAILDGTKTVELRRRRVAFPPGTLVVLYASAPEMALVGTVRVDTVVTAEPGHLWESVATRAGITRREYDQYAAGADALSALFLATPSKLPAPVPLTTLRRACSSFTVPQSYRYLNVEELKSIASTNAAGAELLQRVIDSGSA
ncbi:ASCH domain-containing protein [Streptomyces melanosporofaciens]